MALYVTDGEVLSVTQEFLNEDDTPAIPAPNYPKVRLETKNKDLISSTLAAATATPGVWAANIAIPNFGLVETEEYRIKWIFKDENDDKQKVIENLFINPKSDKRYGDIVVMSMDTEFDIMVPERVDTAAVPTPWSGYFNFYADNLPVLASNVVVDNTTQKILNLHSTVFTLDVPPNQQPSLEAILLRMDIIPPAAKRKTYNYKLWIVTPQIMLGVSHLEDFLNKARIEDIIPELQYTEGDLLSYLERGLYYFNRIEQTTAFSGTNMKGFMFDAWLICSSYYALCAQILAEGMLAFDFSGQSISLNVDRTPQLEAALGRLESQIAEYVKPLKKQLVGQGITTGDGSVGSTNARDPSSSGTLGIINAATTRIPAYSSVFLGNRRRY